LEILFGTVRLDDLRRGLRFCRFADDANIYVRNRRAGERVMASASRFLTDKLPPRRTLGNRNRQLGVLRLTDATIAQSFSKN
jgi:hypothetical protein